MATIEKVSIALSTELLALVKQAVDGGDYASSSEVVREALREWKARRASPAINREIEGASRAAGPVVGDGLALVQSHVRALRSLCRKFQVRKLHVFGSALRADFDPAQSDLDVTVEFGKPKGMALDRQYVDFKAALESLFGRPVDVVELAAMPDSRLKRSIERSQVMVYEQAA
jgi:uncharacterized protein